MEVGPHVEPGAYITPSVASSTDATQWFTREVQPYDRQLKAYLRGKFPAIADVAPLRQVKHISKSRPTLGAPREK